MATEFPRLRYIAAPDLVQHPHLRDSMFRNRAEQFIDRLGWPLERDERGWEVDDYDRQGPIYAIWEVYPGIHGASARFLPTLERTMVADHFAHLCPEGIPSSPLIWESSRFCISPLADRRAAVALVLAHGEIMARFDLLAFIGVFDRAMERVYTRLGVAPSVIGRGEAFGEEVGVGLWEMRADAWEPTLRRLGIDRETSRRWLAEGLRRKPWEGSDAD